MSDDGDMATMPIPDLVAGIRKKIEGMEPLQAMVMGILSGRLMREHERAEGLKVELSKHQESEFHPDWSMLQAGRDSLKEHQTLLRTRAEEIKSLEGDLSRTMAALDQTESNFNGMLKQRNKLADALDEQGIDSDGVLADDDRQ
jgi:exonuclease VII large subunit